MGIKDKKFSTRNQRYRRGFAISVILYWNLKITFESHLGNIDDWYWHVRSAIAE